MKTRWWAASAAIVAGVLASACGTPGPPPRLYQLPLQVQAAAATTSTATAGLVWELPSEVRLPAYLDRETIVIARGSAGLQPLEGHRWAEPLRDAVPRLLRLDLERLRGAGQVWGAPAPEQVAIARKLRVELLSWQANGDRSQVELSARWSLVDPAGRQPPLAASAELQVPIIGSDVDAIATAHRVALWRLAERIAATPG